LLSLSDIELICRDSLKGLARQHFREREREMLASYTLFYPIQCLPMTLEQEDNYQSRRLCSAAGKHPTNSGKRG
jgi:hypothetical protein